MFVKITQNAIFTKKVLLYFQHKLDSNYLTSDLNLKPLNLIFQINIDYFA